MENKPEIYVVGDSTLSCFNDEYYYPRYGYGTKLDQYFNLKVNNLALSGRSSKSFLIEDNYEKLKNNLKPGDFLIIGFGHNDEKYEDPNRFTAANLDVSNPKSFQYYLYNYYVKLALSKKAIPILACPIVRCNKANDFTAENAHITKYGDYRKAIITLGVNTNTTVVDLTTATKKLYLELGYEEAIFLHAWPKAKPETVDTTHLNIYGAKVVAYLFAKIIQSGTNPLAKYIKETLVMPIKENDLVANPNYIEAPYKPFVACNYNPSQNFKLNNKDWFATAFGDNGSNPLLLTTGYFVKEDNNNLIIGQDGEYLKGTIGETEGIVIAFKQIKKEKNFIITTDVEVLNKKVDLAAGFGLMLRDDIYIDQSIPDSSILSNYVACGFYNDENKTNIIYSRENKKLLPTSYNSSYYEVGDKAKLKLARIGQVVNIKVIYKGKTYTKTYTDFDFFAIDNNFFYVGLYATRGTTVKFSNIDFKYTGISQGA